MRSLRALAVLVGLAVVISSPASAQGYFGQNQVQYDKFDWQVLETEHFLIHYYEAEAQAAHDAARMAERAYGRLSRILGHQFREKKPIILYASRGDFGQNNVTGDLGEFTGGVTEGLRHRVLLPFTGDYLSFERVLTHELVHEFQYDIFARGRAGGGLQTLQAVQPPLWFMEGMAEYLSLGPDHAITTSVMRDAALNGRLPTLQQMTMRPYEFNPYEFGEAFWSWVGERWGDDAIGRLMNALPSVGVERAFRRELGLTTEELGDEWKEAMQTKHLANIASLDRVRRFAQPLLSERRSGGQIFIAPALSNDGRYIAFLSNGSFARGEVFIDLWLGDANTGKRIKRLVKSTTNADFEELRLLYSQSSFSPDGQYLAFTAQRQGRDVLYLLDVRRRRTVRRIDLPLEGVTSPGWSPDSRRIVVSGNNGGITDLYVVDADGKNFRQLTNERWGALQPQWSPDGKTIAFVTDRAEDSSMELLRFSPWRLALHDMETGRTELVPGQDGHNLNPQWAPDGRSLAYISDRAPSRAQNVFLYDFDAREHYQLTNVIGSVSAATEYSPTLTWAREADRIAFTYNEDNKYTVWAVNNPRSMRRDPYRAPTRTIVAAADSFALQGAADDTVEIPPAQETLEGRRSSFYRSGSGFRRANDLPISGEHGVRGTISVAALLDSASLALPDTTTFKKYKYRVRFEPDYIARPSVGYVQDQRGNGLLGGTMIVLSDLLGNHHLGFAGEVNGRFSDARLFTAYTNLGGRLQYSTGAFQEPYYFLTGENLIESGGLLEQYQTITRYAIRQAYGVGLYPFNRFTRAELGMRFTNIDRANYFIYRQIDARGFSTPFFLDSIRNEPGINYFSPYVALVSDNSLFGYTGPIFGRRYRLQIQPSLGTLQWMNYLVDYRRYDAIIFNYLTFATRLYADISVGRDEETFWKYLGRPDLVRGYDRSRLASSQCGFLGANPEACNATQLLGSRAVVANAELRFPLIRRFELGILPIALPPLDGLFFFDAGMAWSGRHEISLTRPDNYDWNMQRYPLRSYGLGLRLNLFNYAILRWDYSRPLDTPERKPIWTFYIAPSF
ncbi:MAG TPA: BamA/TamA family outer membrane protein [Gemmatimonadaceae bacterium]|nr:BamA/TamA family outer membrane protein [Gemmatimonadaceae bacterium]